MKGVLGQVAAYSGTAELQGRGTLHLHLLLWLFFTLSADQLTVMFKDAKFRQRVAEFIKANICAYLPGFETASTVKAFKKDSEATYNHPPNPDAVNFEGECCKNSSSITQRQLLQTLRMEIGHMHLLLPLATLSGYSGTKPRPEKLHSRKRNDSLSTQPRTPSESDH